MPQEENSIACGRDRNEYEEGNDEVAGNKEIELLCFGKWLISLTP